MPSASNPGSPLGVSIGVVGRLVAKKQMPWFAARRVIATMKNVHPIWDGANPCSVCQPMRLVALPTNNSLSVAIGVGFRLPLQATVNIISFRPSTKVLVWGFAAFLAEAGARPLRGAVLGVNPKPYPTSLAFFLFHSLYLLEATSKSKRGRKSGYSSTIRRQNAAVVSPWR